MFFKKKINNDIIFSSTYKGLPEIVPIRESKYFHLEIAETNV